MSEAELRQAAVRLSDEDVADIDAIIPGLCDALAKWLRTAGADIWAHGPLCDCADGCDNCDDDLWAPHARRALAVARLINGGAS